MTANSTVAPDGNTTADTLADTSASLYSIFQQTTPAVMAKGVEDTAFYRYARLLALNDVGGDPSRFGIDVATFHAANARRAERFPEAVATQPELLAQHYTAAGLAEPAVA